MLSFKVASLTKVYILQKIKLYTAQDDIKKRKQ